MAPSAPADLEATAVSDETINLSWTASTDNVAVTGYRVERSLNGTSGWSEIAQPEDTSYSDTGRSASTEYFYRVRAQDAADNLSAYSSVASATTDAASGDEAVWPVGYNDAIFTGMSNISQNYNPSLNEVVSHRQYNGAVSEQVIYMTRACTLEYCRFQSNEGPRMDASGGSICNVNWCYIQSTASSPDDHADGIQVYHPTSSNHCVLKLRNTHMRNDNGHTCLWLADGSICDVDVEDCLFTNAGGNSLKGIGIYADQGPSTVRLKFKNVYIQQTGWNTSEGGFSFQFGSQSSNKPTIDLWENVRWCSWNHATGTLTPGDLIPQP